MNGKRCCLYSSYVLTHRQSSIWPWHEQRRILIESQALKPIGLSRWIFVTKPREQKKKERLSAFQHWWNWLALLYRQHLTWHSSTRIWAMKDVTPQFNGKSAFHNHIWISILHSYSKHNTLCSFPSLPTVSVQTTVFVFSRDEPCEYITVKRNN